MASPTGLPLNFFCKRLADLVHGLGGALGIGEDAADLRPDPRGVERTLDAHRHRQSGEIVGAALALGAGDDLRMRQDIEIAAGQIHGAFRHHLEQRAHHFQIVRLGDAVGDGEAAAEIAERRLGVGALAEIEVAFARAPLMRR